MDFYRDMKEIAEIIRCNADDSLKCKMISYILTAKLHYFEEPQEDVLDKIKGYVDHIRNTGMGKKKSLEFIEKFIEGLKKDRKREINMTKMRIYFYILGTKPYYKEVSSVEEAKTMIDAIADFVNTKVDEGVFPDHCSTAGLEEYDEKEKEWVTWYDENGLDFDEHFRAESLA